MEQPSQKDNNNNNNSVFYVKKTNNDNVGNGLFANKNFEKKQVIFKEKPLFFTSGWDEKNHKDGKRETLQWDLTEIICKTATDDESVPHKIFFGDFNHIQPLLVWDENDDQTLVDLAIETNKNKIYIKNVYERVCTYCINLDPVNKNDDYSPSGLGVYNYQSYINHSCLPNSKCVFLDLKTGEAEVVALKPINKDEEITIWYGPGVGPNQDITESQIKVFLKLYFGFDCKCNKHNFKK